MLLLPDFLLIVLGVILQKTLLRDNAQGKIWASIEKLVFYVLLPANLFMTVSHANLAFGSAASALGVGICIMLGGVGLAYLVRYLVRHDDVTHASVFQCGFRFNSYIALALASRWLGAEGLSMIAFLIAVWVPMSNTIVVARLARAVAKRDNSEGMIRGQVLTKHTVSIRKIVKTVLTNPLILATVTGLFVNIAGVHFPEWFDRVFQSLGQGALPLGLLCIGAGLRWSSQRNDWALISVATLQRLVALPALAFLVLWGLGYTGVYAAAILLFAALPTAQSCYVMTAAMRGNASIVASVTTAHVVAGGMTLLFWMWVTRKFFL